MQDSKAALNHEVELTELTFRGMLLGAVLTVIFTASNVYLGLKVGLTFSSAIPAVVISMAVLRMAGGANLFASGLIVGESLIGVLIAAVIAISVSSGGSDSPLALVGSNFAGTAEMLGLIVFVATIAVFCKIVRGKT